MKQIQLFGIAELIFSVPEHSSVTLNAEDIKQIQSRFTYLAKRFEGSEDAHYSAGYVKDKELLPFHAMTIIGRIGNNLILNFTTSLKEPIMFIIDTNTSKYRNYIEIKDAQVILDDDIYEDIKENLSYPKKLDRLFQGISDMEGFIEFFSNELKKHNNSDAITGRDCFEGSLEDL